MRTRLEEARPLLCLYTWHQEARSWWFVLDDSFCALGLDGEAFLYTSLGLLAPRR
jgi:hypothetical protein